MNSFFFVVDEKFFPMAKAISIRLRELYDADVNIFLENATHKLIETIRIQPKVDREFIHFNRLGPLIPKNLPHSDIWPKIVYGRFFAPRLLQHYSRLVYLDADIIPVKQNDLIWNIDLPGGLAAVFDTGAISKCPANKKNKKYPQGHKGKMLWLNSIGVVGDRYFNTGLLVIDPKKWNMYNWNSLISDYMEKYKEHVIMFDQDFLNSIFAENWAELSPAFNFQSSAFNLGLEPSVDLVFIHYSDRTKPWHGLFSHDIDDVYKYGFLFFEKYLKKTGFTPKVYGTVDAALVRLKYAIRKQLWGMGLRLKKVSTLLAVYEKNRREQIAFWEQHTTDGTFCDGRMHWCAPQIQPEILFDGKKLCTPAGADLMSKL
jgi:lipopolysaccharide biosynthesis glycosyltransferase